MVRVRAGFSGWSMSTRCSDGHFLLHRHDIARHRTLRMLSVLELPAAVLCSTTTSPVAPEASISGRPLCLLRSGAEPSIRSAYLHIPFSCMRVLFRGTFWFLRCSRPSFGSFFGVALHQSSATYSCFLACMLQSLGESLPQFVRGRAKLWHPLSAGC